MTRHGEQACGPCSMTQTAGDRQSIRVSGDAGWASEGGTMTGLTGGATASRCLRGLSFAVKLEAQGAQAWRAST